MRLEYLKEEDRDDYLDLLSEFGDSRLTNDQWKYFWDEYSDSDTRVIYLMKFTNEFKKDVTVGTISFLVEIKAHRQLQRCIHIEDVIISPKFRRLGLGKTMIEKAIQEAKTFHAYKAILDCHPRNMDFYEKCGFEPYESQMRINLC